MDGRSATGSVGSSVGSSDSKPTYFSTCTWETESTSTNLTYVYSVVWQQSDDIPLDSEFVNIGSALLEKGLCSVLNQRLEAAPVLTSSQKLRTNSVSASLQIHSANSYNETSPPSYFMLPCITRLFKTHKHH